MSAYCDATTYRAMFGKTVVSDDAILTSALVAVSRMLDRKLGRSFGQSAEPESRVYQPAPASLSLPVVTQISTDDLVSVTSVVIDANGDGVWLDEPALLPSDYLLTPEGAAYGVEPQPYTGLRVTSWGTAYPLTTARVQITGIYGWPAVPEPIKQATAHLTAILRLESPRATTRINELDQTIGVSSSAQSIIKDLLAGYGRTSGLVFA